MAKSRASSKMPSRAKMAEDERKWRAESLVRDTLMRSPQAKKQVAAVLKEMRKLEAKVEKLVKPKGK